MTYYSPPEAFVENERCKSYPKLAFGMISIFIIGLTARRAVEGGPVELSQRTSGTVRQQHATPFLTPITVSDRQVLANPVQQQVRSPPLPATHSIPKPPQGFPGWSALAGVLGLTGLSYGLGRLTARKAQPVQPLEGTDKAFDWTASLATMLLLLTPEAALAAEQSGGYSLASYYTALGTYVLALPGLYSLVTRSVKPKIVRKTYVMPGQNAGGLPMKEIAGKILFYFTAKRGFELKEAGKTVTFRGKVAKKRGQAAFLTFCVFLSLLSLGLVIQTIETASLGQGQGLGNWWYAVSLISPLAGKYYLDNADVDQELQVKIITDDELKETEVIVQGDDAELEGLRTEFDWQEKGMVRVKGLFEEQIKSA
eukprot:EG_transcript_11702